MVGDLNGDGRFGVGDLIALEQEVGKGTIQRDWKVVMRHDLNGARRIDDNDILIAQRFLLTQQNDGQIGWPATSCDW